MLIVEPIIQQNFDCIILPGGLGGAKILAESKEVGNLLQKQEKSGKLIAAICAAPTALKAHSVGLGKQLTSYPSVKDQLVEKYKFVHTSGFWRGIVYTNVTPFQ